MRSMLGIGLVAVGLTLSGWAKARGDDLGNREQAPPEDTQDVPRTPPPTGAIVLFDGQDLDQWVASDGSEPTWELVEEDAMEVRPGGNGIKTKQDFDGSFRLHVEFRVPDQPEKAGQARGNSGVYLQGRYEVQILESHGVEPTDTQCGAIYEVSAPLVNACKVPTVWQSFDIEFHAPNFERGKKVQPARMTVYHNGVRIQEDVEIPVDNTRSGLGGDPSTPGPIHLQDHGDPVQFREIWLVPLG